MKLSNALALPLEASGLFEIATATGYNAVAMIAPHITKEWMGANQHTNRLKHSVTQS